MSDCKRMTVLAVGVDEDGNIQYAKNENTSLCSGEEGNCGCEHAEARLLVKMVRNPKIVFITHSPCEKCAEMLVEAGVTTVYFINQYRKTEGIELLLSNNVSVVRLEDGKQTRFMLTNQGVVGV